jgi:hypothetical protein
LLNPGASKISRALGVARYQSLSFVRSGGLIVYADKSEFPHNSLVNFLLAYRQGDPSLFLAEIKTGAPIRFTTEPGRA